MKTGPELRRIRFSHCTKIMADKVDEGKTTIQVVVKTSKSKETVEVEANATIKEVC